MAEIQVVLLDLWQTILIDEREWGRERTRIRLEGAQQALQDFGESYTEDHLREAYRSCYRTCRAVREEGRDLTFKQQVETFVGNIDNGLLERIDRQTFARILNRYADAFYDSPPAIADGVHDMLETLKLRDYRLGLISNTGMTPGRLFRAFMEKVGIIEFFDQLTFSDEIMMSKPAPAIFLHTLTSMGALIEHTVFVGDHLRNDIMGAQELGMRTVWVEGFDTSGLDVTPTTSIEKIADLPDALEHLKQS
jgi:putative hydrolase of the HAD superfamily